MKAATSAGLGWIGRNDPLINPKCDTRLSLAIIVTDASLKINSLIESSQCGEA